MSGIGGVRILEMPVDIYEKFVEAMLLQLTISPKA